MKASSKFGKGGCYTCGDCGRQTRQTGLGDNENCGLCADCFEKGSIENQMSDEGETPDLLREWQGYVDASKAKGGKPSEEKWWSAKWTQYVPTGKAGTRSVDGEAVAVFEYEEVDEDGNRTGDRVWRDSDSNEYAE